jgi:hypothetical protein
VVGGEGGSSTIEVGFTENDPVGPGIDGGPPSLEQILF